jgi:dipeptidyl aminopeptidase/acylaminoacyl peptidase
VTVIGMRQWARSTHSQPLEAAFPRGLLWLLLLCAVFPAWSLPAPPTIDALRARKFTNALRFERALDAGTSFTAYLVSYECSGLRLFAYVAVPRSDMPAGGYPVLVANHGTHPNPPRYGYTAAGVDSRPGDYYRSIPELFTARGFLVVMPDYRGHNSSEGGEYAKGFLASNYYAEDVLALLAALPTLERADVRNVFMWGHSLGGEVTLKALLATDRVRGASLWSTVGGDIWDKAYRYSRRAAVDASYDSSDIAKDAVLELKKELESFGTQYDWRGSEPLRFLGYLRAPLILHHSLNDGGAAFEWSRRLAKELYLLGHRYEFYTYAGSDHFFQGQDMQQAADRDARFFRGLMTGGTMTRDGTAPRAAEAPMAAFDTPHGAARDR